MKKKRLIAILDGFQREAETLGAINRQAEADFSKRQTSELNSTRAAAHEFWSMRLAQLIEDAT